MIDLFFVRGGLVDLGQTSKFRVAGQWGYYWSSRASSSTGGAYYFTFWDSGVTPSIGISRYVGYSLRCLIPTTQS